MEIENINISYRPGRKSMVFMIAFFALFAAAMSSCSSKSSGSLGASSSVPASSSSNAQATITIKNFAYTPVLIKVKPGEVIQVINEDGVAHTLSARNNSFNTGDILPGEKVAFKAPTKPGSYRYYCEIHQYMEGTLVVH